MAKSSNIERFRRSIPFTIDGQSFTTNDPSLRALTLLRMAGLDPAIFDLGELEGRGRPQTKRFRDDEIVSIVKDARFISIRQSAPVAQ